MRPSHRSLGAVASCLFALILVGASFSAARADTADSSRSMFGGDVTVGGALLLAAPQSVAIEPLGGVVSLAGRFLPLRWLGLELDAEYAGFLGVGGTSPGGAFFGLGGLRFQPFDESWGTLYLGGDAGAGLTGSNVRFAFDFDVGARFPIGALRIGPVLRVQDLTSGGAAGGDTWLMLMGLTIGLGS